MLGPSKKVAQIKHHFSRSKNKYLLAANTRIIILESQSFFSSEALNENCPYCPSSMQSISKVSSEIMRSNFYQIELVTIGFGYDCSFLGTVFLKLQGSIFGAPGISFQ